MQLANEELEQLKELQEISTLADTPGWLRLKTKLKEWVEEAHVDVKIAYAATDPQLAALARREQQREAVSDSILDYVDGCVERRATLLNELAEREKEHTSYAASPVGTA